MLPQVMFGGYLFFLLLGAIFVLHWSGYLANTFFVNRLEWRMDIRRATAQGVLCGGLGRARRA